MRPPTEEYAAGFRKVLIKNFNCISCDRPVDFARERMFPPLPSAQALPNKKSNRPYTTFELDQIRQHMIRGGMEMEQERFEALDNRRRKLQSEILKLRYWGIVVFSIEVLSTQKGSRPYKDVYKVYRV